MLKRKKTNHLKFSNFSLKKNKGIRNLLLFLLSGLFLAYFIFGDYGFLRIGHLISEQKRLRKSIIAISKENDSLALIKQKFTKDSSFIEKLARENLGMSKKDETVFIFINPK